MCPPLAGIPVPLDHMMQGIPELQLGGNSSSKKGDKAGKEKEKSSKAKEATAASSDAKPSARRRSTSKAASEKAEKTGGKTEKAGEKAGVVQAPPPPNPWAFLLSVCMILFGVWFSWYSSGGAQ